MTNDKQIILLSTILDINVETLTKIACYGILDWKKARNVMIRNQYEKLVLEEISMTEITSKLMKMFGVSRSLIEIVVYNKVNNKPRSCVSCGNIVTVYKFRKHGGKCDKCVI